MGELEELLEKSNIKFPRPINRNAARHLLMLIMRDMPAAHVGYSSTVRGDIDRLDEETEKLKLEESDAEFGGTISNKRTRRTSYFKLGRVDRPDLPGGYCSLIFNTIPGYRLDEHDPNEVEIWKRTREIVEDYFSQNLDILSNL